MSVNNEKKQKKTTMKKKVLVVLVPVILLLCTLLTVLIASIAKSSEIEMSKSLLEEVSTTAADSISSLLEEKKTAVEVMASISSIQSKETTLDEKLDVLRGIRNNQGYYNIGYASVDDGIAHYVTRLNENINERDYYKEALKGNTYISEPYKSIVDGKIIIAIATPVKTGTEITGVIVAVRGKEDFSNIVKEISPLESGETFMLDSKGVYIANNDESKVTGYYSAIDNEEDTTYSEVAKKMINGESGVENVEVNGDDNVYVSYAPIDFGWSIGIKVDESDIMAGVYKVMYALSGISIIFTIVLIALGLLVVRRLTKPMKDVEEMLAPIKQGDFTKGNTKYIDDKTEIGRMFESIRAVSIEIKDSIKSIKEGNENVDNQSTNLAALSEEMSALTENITTAIEEVANGATSQATDLTHISGELEKLGEDINNVSESIGHINTNAMEIGEKSHGSNKELSDLAKVIRNLDGNFNTFKISIAKMAEEIKEVNDMTTLINEISEQTDLLALNAAIEAARAGEAGKGFTVVAEEIRKLAEMSKDSSQKINVIVDSIVEKTEDISNKTEVMSEDINTQNKVVNKTISTFTGITSGIKDITPKINMTVKNVNAILNKKNAIINKVENISAVSEEISANAEEVSAASNELNSASVEIASSAQNLNNLTNDMNVQTGRFKVE